MIGVYLLIGPSGDVNWTGALLALLATILFSFQLAATQWLLVGYPVRSIVFYVTIIMAAFVVGWWVILGAPWTDLGPGQWAIVLVLAIVSTVVARLAYYGAVGRIGSGQLALFGPLETLLSVIWSILFLNEQLSPVQFLGGALILFSAMLAVERFGRVNLRIPRR
jgi:drug/metabolite transporter (DMT)-like permease